MPDRKGLPAINKDQESKGGEIKTSAAAVGWSASWTEFNEREFNTYSGTYSQNSGIWSEHVTSTCLL